MKSDFMEYLQRKQAEGIRRVKGGNTYIFCGWLLSLQEGKRHQYPVQAKAEAGCLLQVEQAG
jgi:hypothetical protein